MGSAHGHTRKGRLLDEYVGPRLAPFVMPAYYQCIRRPLPVRTIAHFGDIFGRIVAYERLLLPLSATGAVGQSLRRRRSPRTAAWRSRT